MDTVKRLREAKQLLDEGIINEEEYERLKTRLLDELDAEHSDSTQSVTQSYPTPTMTKSAPVSSVIDEEGASTGMKVLSFLFPIVGLILFLIDKDKKPVAAKEELKWAGIGFAIGILLYIITLAIGGCTAASYY